MNIEKWIIAHFSPTGGTKKVADAIAAGFNIPVVEMDLTKANSTVTLGQNDALMAVLPVHAGRVPQISLELPNETLGDVCINCMRCVQVCPQQCRALPAPFVAGATQMLNEKAAGYKKSVVFL